MVDNPEMSSPEAEHRAVAGRFTALVLAARAETWDDPSPVPEWRARDVVGHLVEWLPAFLEGGSGVQLPTGPSVEEDPVGAWQVHCAGVQALLEDPATHERLLRNPHVGELPVDEAISRFYTGDVFLHTWDLARATGQDPALDPERCGPDAGRHGAARRPAAQQRAVRATRIRPSRRRPSDAARGVHRTRPGLALRPVAGGPSRGCPPRRRRAAG